MSVFFLFEVYIGYVLMAVKDAKNDQFCVLDAKEYQPLEVSDAADARSKVFLGNTSQT